MIWYVLEGKLAPPKIYDVQSLQNVQSCNGFGKQQNTFLAQLTIVHDYNTRKERCCWLDFQYSLRIVKLIFDVSCVIFSRDIINKIWTVNFFSVSDIVIGYVKTLIIIPGLNLLVKFASTIAYQIQASVLGIPWNHTRW